MIKKTLIKKLLLAFAGFLAVGVLHAAPSAYEPAIVKAFADSLYTEGFFNQAEGEYKRYLFSIENTGALSTTGQQEYQDSLLALCNIYKKHSDVTGISWLKNGFFDSAEPFVKQKINHVQGSFIFKERDSLAFSAFVQSESVAGQSALFTPEFVNLINASDLVLKKDISGLSELCTGLVTENANFEKLLELSNSYKLKSPGLALFLSAILPGCGKWYTGSFGAFASSFLTVGTFIAGTVFTGIQTEWKSWQPYVFGACGLVLYITDLYGAWQSAKRYNDALFRILCEETDRLYDVTY